MTEWNCIAFYWTTDKTKTDWKQATEHAAIYNGTWNWQNDSNPKRFTSRNVSEASERRFVANLSDTQALQIWNELEMHSE